MKKFRSIYWRFFNVLARITGFLFFVGGSIMVAYGMAALRNQQMQKTDAWIMIISAFIVAVFGILIMIAKPYQPRDSEKQK